MLSVMFASDLEMGHGAELMGNHRRFRHRCKSTSMRDLHRYDMRMNCLTD